MFLTVWLRRQEIDYHRTKTIVVGLLDTIRQDGTTSVKAFDEFRGALFPFLSKEKKETDKALIGTMEKEVGKGSISFNPLDLKPVRHAMDQHKLPDEFRAKLKDSLANRRKRRSS